MGLTYKSSVVWGYAPEWAAYHAFDEVRLLNSSPTGVWWSARPQRFSGKSYWENPNNRGDVDSESSGFRITEDIDWRFSIESRPEVIRPIVVCLCGSTRFWKEFQRASLSETLAGKIVLSIGAASGTDDDHFGNLPREEYDQVKEMLDRLHLHKIDLADEILVLSQDGYIGSSTRKEIDYAISVGRRVRWAEESAKETYYGTKVVVETGEKL